MLYVDAGICYRVSDKNLTAFLDHHKHAVPINVYIEQLQHDARTYKPTKK